MPAHTNRLAGQASPYLLQHAHNPVDWWPWGDDAIDEARGRDVPILLSIGYSTCYWCHVMERESFEHGPTAALMNERFVCVKVDREERPDLDDAYMAATVLMTGHGGWPMSVFIDPQSLRPYWCGTYFPREPRHGMPTFARVLEAMSEAWRTQRGEVLEQAARLGEGVADQLARRREPVPVGRPQIERCVRTLLTMLDRTNGGFGGAPKFPQPVFLEFLLDARAGADPETAAAIDAAVRLTLDQMMIGGIHDHAGGGFHRYAVDATWTVPHFEKMLYDNAQLLSVYARAGEVYDDEQYRRTARRTAAYVLAEMTDPAEPGALGFWSAQDAEVDGREGLNYLWTPEQVRGALDADDAAFAIDAYALDAAPNFKDPHDPEAEPSFVLRLRGRPDALAREAGTDTAAFTGRLDRVNAALLAARALRKQPRLDDKVLSSWNGLMIGALARASVHLGDPALADAAARAARFVCTAMRPTGPLLRSVRQGRPGPGGVLEDSAFMIDALVALHATPAGSPEHLAWAIDIAARAIEDFGAHDAGFYDARADQSDVFVRARSTHDGALPSGSGAMLGALIGLADATGDDDRWLVPAGNALRAISPAIAESPAGCANACRHLLALMRRAGRLDGGVKFATGGDEAPAGDAPVEVLADAESVTVREGEPGELHLALNIHPPHHIVAADPGAGGEGLVPLRVGLVSGQGVAVYADYPDGEPYGVESVGTINVHTGQVELRVALERAEGIGPTPGEPVLGVTFQACTDAECHAPKTLALSVRIELE